MFEPQGLKPFINPVVITESIGDAGFDEFIKILPSATDKSYNVSTKAWGNKIAKPASAKSFIFIGVN